MFVKAVLLVVLILSNEGVSVAREIKERTDKEKTAFGRAKTYISKFRGGRDVQRKHEVMAVSHDEDLAHNAVLLSLDMKARTGTQCFGVCTAM